jgi:excisionase family DNA binding protein
MARSASVRKLTSNDISVKLLTMLPQYESGELLKRESALTEFLLGGTTTRKGVPRMSSAKPAFETIQFSEQPDRLVELERRENGRVTGSDLRLLTPRQVADRLGVSERWVRDHATRRSPRIPVVKLGSLLRFRDTDIDKFLSQNSVVSSSKEHSGRV